MARLINQANEPHHQASPPSMRVEINGTSNSQGQVRQIGAVEGFLTFNPVGQALIGYAESAYSISRSPLTLLEGLGNLASDAYGFGKDAILGPERGVMGDVRPYEASNGIVRSVLDRGALATVGDMLHGGILGLPGISTINAVIHNDPAAVGASLPGAFLAGYGVGAKGATGSEYLTSAGRISRYENHLTRLSQNGYANTEALAEFSGRIEMLKRGYVLEGDGKLVGNISNPGGGKGSNGIDRVYRNLANPDDLVALESKYRAQFNGNSPLDLLGDTRYGKQMSTQWMDRKIDQMMFGPHGPRINQLGENLFMNGYQGRYMNVLNGNGSTYFYDLQALGLK